MSALPVLPELAAAAPRWAELRRDLHAHPELRFAEHRTSDRVAEALGAMGIEVHRGLGGTGVVGVLRAGTSPRAIALRADMDALPMTEHNGFAHASRHPGRMHACGHDGHTAMLLAAAERLAQRRDVDGTVVFVFQPAEEGGAGARAMMQDGLFDRFPVDAIYGMHNWPGLPAGTFAVCDGPMLASSNELTIRVTGRGSHAALPHDGIDPIPVACQLVLALQTILTRNKRPTDAAVLSITMIHGGEATNVVPETCELRGTVRTFTLEVLDLIEARLRAVAEHTCAAAGATCEVRFDRNYPPTINHPGPVALVRDVMREVVGADRTLEFQPTMGAEDFSFYLLEKPGAYFVVGNGVGDHRAQGHGLGPCTLHNPSYDFNDEILPLGATLWVRLVERALG
ncbi:MAG TPA: M20 aminoacylase family protein [Myxococcota bacterium]|nr:M20 aminoacylase family protein [Myxococcota bacterium]